MMTDNAAMEEVKRLDRAVSELKKVLDVDGLRRLEAKALVISTKSGGRTRRKARRLASKASGAVQEIQGNEGETELERAQRTERVNRELRWRHEEAVTKLLGRSVAFLHLVLFEGSPVSSETGPLQNLASVDDDGFLHIEIPEVIRSRSDLLLTGFERSRQIFMNASRPRRSQAERTLKTLAVQLVSDGAEVRNAMNDPVPLIAYGLFFGRLQFESNPRDIVNEKVDDIMLGISDDAAQIPPSIRSTFIGLFRVALLLGQAEAFADCHSVTTLSTT